VITFPLSFKSSVQGHVYRHIVLAVKARDDMWGALGISRSDKLMYKDIKFKSMGELINEFKLSYESVCHELLKVYVGLPFCTEVQASGPIRWRALKLNLQTQAACDVEVATSQFVKNSKSFLVHLNRTGKLPQEMESPSSPLNRSTNKSSRKSEDGDEEEEEEEGEEGIDEEDDEEGRAGRRGVNRVSATQDNQSEYSDTEKMTVGKKKLGERDFAV
jgi:hypothetical protein